MPLTVIVPAVGVSRSAATRRNVVLPQPDGPMKLTKSPRPTLRSTSFSACTGPSAVSNVSPSPRASMTGRRSSGPVTRRQAAITAAAVRSPSASVVGPAETEMRMISRPRQRPWLG